MAGSVISTVLISDISSDLPGAILARVSQNVVDRAIGKYVPILQGSRLIRRLPERVGLHAATCANRLATADLFEHLEHESVADAGHRSERLRGLLGSDQQPPPRTFETAALMSLISESQMVGLIAAFGGSGTHGLYGYYQSNQTMAGEMAGSSASGQFGGLGQQMIGNGLNRPPTTEILPGYRFNAMVNQDLVFPG
jgi:type IV secretion system protein VirB10